MINCPSRRCRICTSLECLSTTKTRRSSEIQCGDYRFNTGGNTFPDDCARKISKFDLNPRVGGHVQITIFLCIHILEPSELELLRRSHLHCLLTTVTTPSGVRPTSLVRMLRPSNSGKHILRQFETQETIAAQVRVPLTMIRFLIRSFKLTGTHTRVRFCRRNNARNI